MKRLAWIVAIALVASVAVFGQANTTKSDAPRVEVLVLGTYHMANPGHDIHNVQADDVLAPKRQAEIGDLMEVLKRFHPTKIAVEANPNNDRLTALYNDYLAGKHELTRNEIEQIGFRLAKQLGHAKIYGVDADGDFPWLPLVDYAKAHGRTQELDAIDSGWGEMAKKEGEYLNSHTVLDTLLFVNDDDQVAKSTGLYYRAAQLGEPYDWAGGDLLADWYRRNIRIYTNVLQLADSPNERVLVIFGAGHLGWLRYDFASNPNVRLRKLAEFVK